jgi:hypothetical protein
LELLTPDIFQNEYTEKKLRSLYEKLVAKFVPPSWGFFLRLDRKKTHSFLLHDRDEIEKAAVPSLPSLLLLSFCCTIALK